MARRVVFWIFHAVNIHADGAPFSYLRARRSFDRDGVHSPYDLQVVPYSLVDPADYYTLSLVGVTHFSRSEPSEFLPLQEWVRMHACYRAALEVPTVAK